MPTRGGIIGQQATVDSAFLGLHLIALQAAQAALIAALVFALGRARQRSSLSDWGWSWSALSIYYLLMIVAAPLAPGAARVALRMLGAMSGLCSAFWLVQGTRALLGRGTRAGRGWLIAAASAGAAGAGLPLLATSPLLSSGTIWLVRCTVVGATYVACAWLLWRHSGRAAIGRILLPTAFLLYGFKLWWYLALGIADVAAGAVQFRSVSLLGLSDLWLQAAMGLGTVVWLLEREHEHLKELDRLKSDLLANVSHELRTPLTAILGYSELMLSASLGRVSEAQERALKVVLRNGERLSRSIGALLDFARLDAGRAILVVRPFALPQWLEQALAPLRPELDRAGLTLVTHAEPDLSAVKGDAEKLAQVLENLVVNAMKFTPAGGRITVAARRVADNSGPCAEISVTDTGIGIPAAQLEHIFERFFQVDASATRRVGGVGLGLSIVKGILDAHHATIHVASEPGRGSCFRFMLPLEEPVASTTYGLAAGRNGSPLILVVDDDDDVQRFARATLEAHGFGVLSAFTSEEGATLAARQRPDLVLLDLMLPDRSGLDVLQALKSNRETADLPVIVLSATHERTRALALGAADYLRKPIQPEVLMGLVQRVLKGPRADNRLTILVVDDEADTVALLREALSAEGWCVLTAQDGREALASIERQQPDLILLDMLIPGPSGFDVLAILGRSPTTARIPVVVLSARGDDISVRQGLALGARKYLSKPFDMRELLAEVRRQLPTARMTPAEPYK